jgi:NO-binding membrane sensor protein with MHYT domain
MLRELLYEESYFLTFILISVVLGGGAGWLTGRAIAHTWRPWWKVVLATLLLGLGVRFIHFALFDATFLSLHYYTVDTLIALVFALAGYRVTRSQQMAQQYGFLRSS